MYHNYCRYNNISNPRGIVDPVNQNTISIVFKQVVRVFPKTGNSYEFYVCCIEPRYTLGLRKAANKWVPHYEFYKDIARITY